MNALLLNLDVPDLAAAEAKGDAKRAKDAKQSIETYQSWLEQARETLADFTG